MVSRQSNHPLASNAHSRSEPTMTVRSVLLKREPGRSTEGESIHHRRRHKTQQVRFKDLADGPEEVVVGGRTTEGNCLGVPALQNWYPARPCSLTLPNPRKACMSTAIQTSPSLQKHSPACRVRSKSVSDLGAEDGKEEGGDPPSDLCPAGELVEGQDAEEEGEEDHEGVVKEQQGAAINGRMVEAVTTSYREHCPSAQDREKVCEKISEEVSEKILEEVSQKVQDSNSNGSSARHRAQYTTVPKAVPGTLSESNFKAFTAGQHCATKGVTSLSAKPCSPISKVSPPSSKDNDMDRYSLSQRPCHKLKALRHDLDGDLPDYGKTESSPTNPNHTLAKEQTPTTFPKSCLKTPLNPKQPGISHRTDQSQPCISAVDHSQPTDVKNQPSQPLAKSPVRSGEGARQDGHSGPALKADVQLELVLSGGNPQANATEPAAAAGNPVPKPGRTTQYEITSLQSRLQNMEDVLQTSQQTIKVLLDVIQDLEKKEAVRDGRQSYHTGQDIVNCGTCRDCACIIYSVEHDFRQQEGRFHRVLSSLETEAGQSAELPSTPSKRDESPTPRLAARTEPKKSKRKCFWFL